MFYYLCAKEKHIVKQKSRMITKKILLNLAAVVWVVGLLWFCCLEPGYQHIKNIEEGYFHFAKRNPGLSLEDRYAVQWGGIYTLLRHVKENTSEDAVIYLPSATHFTKDAWSDLFYNHHSETKLVATRFLYPRKVVTEQEFATYGMFLPITHIIVVGAGGRDVLPYSVGDINFAVFPISNLN